MIDSKRLLADLQKLLKVLEADIRERLEMQPDRVAELDAEWRAARDARRTAATQFEWREERTTQAGVHWILGTVFLRFLEDNGYLERPFLFGPDAHTQALAIDRHARYFREHPDRSDREYLLDCFAEAAALPGLGGLFDTKHNPLYRLELTGDGAMALRDFWRRVDPDTGVVVHDFSDPAHGTRFLGDLYQDLSESARKRYALLQTPEFVEEFILDRTLAPAIGSFGYRVVRLIDPTSGSGHFLLGAFQRLFAIWQREEPARNLPDLTQRALDAVYGVDLNPFAVEIARFRLLIAALNVCGIERLRNAPNFRINLAAGDSLLHGRRFGQLDLSGEAENLAARYTHAYATEDLSELNRILDQRYHAVVGNPPYITPKDAALNEIYRSRYSACHMKYSLGVPFTERFFGLATEDNGNLPAGFVGMITANSFMKREFGRKLIEEFLPTVDVTHVIDTSGAYIPGHGTPTAILFGRNRAPVSDHIRVVMGISGEQGTPADPSTGLVWRSIIGQVDHAGAENSYISVADRPRSDFKDHPWSIGGGGVAEIKILLERGRATLGSLGAAPSIGAVTLEDEAFLSTRRDFHRARLPDSDLRPFVQGLSLRDWVGASPTVSIYPYRADGTVTVDSRTEKYLWPLRTRLWHRMWFRKSQAQRGLEWFEYGFLAKGGDASLGRIGYGEVATHNHFVLVEGPCVFDKTAPVIEVPRTLSDRGPLSLLGLLNSSVACFWLKQVCFPKGGDHVGQEGARVRKTLWDERYAFNATNIADFPVTDDHPTVLAETLDRLARDRAASMPDNLLGTDVPTRAELDAARVRACSARARMIALQEELDWRCYRLYGLMDGPLEHPNPPELALGERAFEIVLARRVVAGNDQTTWFERHGSTPITELPSRWPADYRVLIERRIALIESDQNIGLIERPEYKRRWNDEPWDAQERHALRDWLLNRLETERYWPRGGDVPMRSTSRLADLARGDTEFMQIAVLFTGNDSFDVGHLVAELVESEAVPFLSVLRYTDDGLRKRAAWEHTWELQRQEDATGTRLDVPVPPKYRSSDFRSGDCWRLRGPLDVPKERFVSYPGATLDADGTLVITWAGYDHLQQAKALAGHYLDLKDNHGWGAERLIPLMAGLVELLPWLKQWHNEPDATLGERMGDYFEGFVQDEARAMGVTIAEVQAWRPQAAVRGRRRRS
jgi:hypothetical protein